MKNENQNFPEVDLNKILSKEPNRFLIVSAAAKRARQIKEGSRPLIPVDMDDQLNYVAIALKEIEQGLIDITIKDNSTTEEDYISELDSTLEDALQVKEESEQKQKNKVSKAQQALSMIEKLYKADHLAAKQQLSSAQRLELRTEYKFKEHLETLQAWCEKSLIHVPLKSGIGEAIAYATKYLPKLNACITNGAIEVDNNLAENLIRPIALGRKNFLFLGAESGMQAASIFYSLIQTCKANQMNAYEYLSYLLTTITRHDLAETLDQLMPFHPKMVEKFQLKKS